MEILVSNLVNGTGITVRTPEDVYDEIENIVGYELADNGTPYCIEVSSWSELATVGEIYEHEKFTVEIL